MKKGNDKKDGPNVERLWYKLRRNKLACVLSKFISLKHSLTRVFDVRYMDILFVRPIITVSR